jgi:hypothetical protein
LQAFEVSILNKDMCTFGTKSRGKDANMITLAIGEDYILQNYKKY